MPRSRWFIVIAVIGLGLLLLATIGYYRIQEAQSDSYPDARHNPARNATEPVATQQQQVAPPAYDPRCQSPQNREDSDLCAQWSAVEAMKEANRVTQIALTAGWFEFIALLVSIFFTGWAAIAASRAAKFAEAATKDADRALEIAARNADAAAQQVRISEDTARRQLRAYISAPGAQLSNLEPGKVPAVTLFFKNGGQTPAHNVTSGCWMRMTTIPDNWTPDDLPDEYFDPLPDGGPRIGINNLGVGEQTNVEFVMDVAVDPQFFARYGAGSAIFLAWGEIKYVDAFGAAQITEFRLWHDRRHRPAMNFGMFPSGNRAT